MSRWLLTSGAFAAIALAGLVPAQAAFMPTVLVGDPGNAPSTGNTSWGGVSYLYRIGQFEVTNAQYIDFLNAVARVSDPYYLYSSLMAGTKGGISRYGNEGNYTYGPKNGDAAWLNRPVNVVSFWDTCRFANWLHNGRPVGQADATTTEDGAYTLNGYNGQDGRTISRNPGARWAIPSFDEWYKAAYYKGGSTNAGYWRFPTRSDLPPSGGLPPGASEPPGSANIDGDYPYYTTPVGAYTFSTSPYGTYDQGGNVWEWAETLSAPQPNDVWPRIQAGQSYGIDSGWPLQSSGYRSIGPGYAITNVGFRVVYIPEPAALTLALLGILAFPSRRA